jgi:perosamine synthetase
MKKIPFYKPPITIHDYLEVFRTIASGWLTTGKRNFEFSRKLAEYLGIEERNVVLVSSCTAGLHLLFDAFDLKGKEIIIPAITFISPVEMALLVGAKPIIVDVDYDCITISPEEVEKKINNKVGAVIPTYYGGNSYDRKVLEIASSKGIVIIEDAAHAFGTKVNGVKVGNVEKLGVDATVFSFYATKTLHTGEGGAVITNNERVLDKIKKTRLHGMDHNAWSRYQNNLVGYDITEVGFKYNFPDILASVGIAQLKVFEKMQRERKRVWDLYFRYLSDLDTIRLPKIRENTETSYHLFTIRLNTEMWSIDKLTFIKLLNDRGIGTSVHFTPVYRFTKYREILKPDLSEFKNSEKIFSEIVSLPIYPSLSNREVEYICGVIRDLSKKYKK